MIGFERVERFEGAHRGVIGGLARSLVDILGLAKQRIAFLDQRVLRRRIDCNRAVRRSDCRIIIARIVFCLCKSGEDRGIIGITFGDGLRARQQFERGLAAHPAL